MEQSLAQNLNKIEINIKTCHVTYNISRDLNFEDVSISGFHVEQGLKVTILY